jgi:guanylate kinase
MAIPDISSPAKFIEAVRPLLEEYQPSDGVTEYTRHVDLTTISGPRGSGKNTIMTESGLPVIVADTTRMLQYRDGKWEEQGVDYHFRNNDLPNVYHDIALRHYVQVELIDLGPKGMDVYGSRWESYPTEGPALIDVVAAAVPKIRALRPNFKSIEAAYVVTKDADTLIRRLEGRGVLSPEEWAKSLKEAHDSLLLAHEDEETHFILNEDAGVAGGELHDFAIERRVDTGKLQLAKKCAHGMLHGLGSMLGKSQTFNMS